MRVDSAFVAVLAACGVDGGKPTFDPDPHAVDGGTRPEQSDGGMPTMIVDAREVPPDGIPAGLEPCEEAAYHSDFTWIQTSVFDVSCTDGCHSGTSPSAGMNLTPGASYAALLNAASTQFSGWVRVVPGDARASMLMVQIGGESGPPLEGLMPWGQPRLCDEQVDAIRRWIVSGAALD
jgi:hypothetical protein